MQLTTNVLGVFVIKNGRIILQKTFPSDVNEIAGRLRKTEAGFCREEADLVKELIDTGNKRIFVNNPIRFRGSGFNVVFMEEKERISVYKIATELYLNRQEVDSLMRKVNRVLSRERLKEVDRDQVLMQAVNSIDDIDEAYNRLIERLREWYSIHYPELDNLVASHEVYAKFVMEIGSRDGFRTAKLGVEPMMGQKIVKASEDSMGVEFNDEDLKAVKAFTSSILALQQAKTEVESYLGVLMQEVAPNINALAGPLLGARLIALGHGLQRLATLPAGTIQMLGAEDAFFRFLKTGKRPPKHGIIFQLPAIRNAKRNVRGKIARNFAAKVALASRIDAYKGDFSGDKLKEAFEKRVKTLQ